MLSKPNKVSDKKQVHAEVPIKTLDSECPRTSRLEDVLTNLDCHSNCGRLYFSFNSAQGDQKEFLNAKIIGNEYFATLA